MTNSSDYGLPPVTSSGSADAKLQQVVSRLAQTIERDRLVQQTTDNLRALLQVDRVVLYYFYRPWKGQVTFESLSQEKFSIFGSTGPDECFGQEYASLYQAGRIRAIADLETEPIQDCHREFLQKLQVRSNLVVPILIPKGLWGLLIAHHCQAPYHWTAAHIATMQNSAKVLATAPAIRES